MRLACSHKLFPLTHRLFHRRQRTAHDDGGGDHDPGRDLLLDRQIGTDAKNGDLQGHANKLGRRHDGPCPARSLGLRIEHSVMLLEPTVGQRLFHAERTDHFGVLHCCVDEMRCSGIGCARLLQKTACGELVCQRQSKDDNGTDSCHQTKPRMEGKDQRQEQGNPRRVKEREDPLPRHEFAHPVHILQRGMRARVRCKQLFAHHAVEGRIGQHVVELQPRPHEHLGADEFENPVGDQQSHRDTSDHQQGEFVPAGQHAVIDLQHVKRPDKHQEVRKETEDHRGKDDRLEPSVSLFEG